MKRAPLLAALSDLGFSESSGRRSDPFARLGTANGNGRVQQGTDEFLGPSGADARPLFAKDKEGDINLNLVNVEIADAAKAVLGDALGLNYSIKPDVSGTITLQTTRPLDKQTLLETFQRVLELNGATLNRVGDLTTIEPFGNSPPRIQRQGERSGVGPRIVAVPLNYVGTAEMERLLTPIVGNSVSLESSSNRNLLMISGTRDEVNAAIEAINLFDADVLKGKSVALFKLRAADPEAVAGELELIFESYPGGSLENVVVFVPNQRLSSVLVISSRSKYLDEARDWIKQLDATAGGSRRRPVVYELENRSAEQLAPILAQMSAGTPSATEEDNAAIDAGSVRVIADNAKNAVIVWGNDQEQEDFGRLIVSLDTTPVQVLLEATIAEVALNDELEFGLRWFFQNNRIGGGFSDIASGAVASNFPGLSLLFQANKGNIVMNALSSVTDVNIVSSPSLMVLDNEEATLQIGDQVPVATQQVTDSNNATTTVANTISFRDTGIILTVRPRVSEGGRVTLDIEQEVSSVSSTTTSGIDSPTISQRKINTKVVVNNGTTLALGGLIQDSRNKTKTKVPIAGDIPVLGNLFKSKSNSKDRTELLILITPRVVRNGNEARSVTAEFRERLAAPDKLIYGQPEQSDTHRILE